MSEARWRGALGAGAGLVAFLAVAAPAAADAPPSFETLAQECYANGGDFRFCRSLEQLGRSTAGICRFPDLADESCGTLDGRSISPARVQAYQSSWTHRALGLQRRLDDRVPLARGLIPGTHNSFNSAHYYPTLSGLDHNQVHSLPEQLDMDIRGLELDVHWMPSPYGDVADGGFAPVICHALDQQVSGGIHVHPGCTAERPLREGLAEIHDWLVDHPDQFLLLYLENHLDDDAGHAAAARAIADELGALVLQTSTPCEAMPGDMSRAEILGGGHQVLIVGDCGPAPWGSWVHERNQSALWRESLDLPPPDYPGCAALHGNGGEDDYDTHFIRSYEDSTWLSAMASGSQDPITLADTQALVQCGVNLTGFDQLTPEDPRLKALVWSWAENEPGAGGTCARRESSDHHFYATGCSTSMPYACKLSGDSWAVTAASGAWAGGFDACSAEYPQSKFAVPSTGYDNELLGHAPGAETAALWVNYAAPGGGDWTPDLPAGTTP